MDPDNTVAYKNIVTSDNQEANSYVNSFGTCNLNEITWTNGLASEILSEQPQDHPTLTPVMSGQTPMDFLSDNDNNFSQLTEFGKQHSQITSLYHLI